MGEEISEQSAARDLRRFVEADLLIGRGESADASTWVATSYGS